VIGNNIMSSFETSMGSAEIEGESDPVEKLFGRIALEQGLLLSEAEMVKLPGKKENKWDKKSTVPDFLIKSDEADSGIYVEVTKRNDQSGGKNSQRKVMEEAGLGSRYVQLTGIELEKIKKEGMDLMGYIKNKIRLECSNDVMENQIMN
jgi:hypothetical protein